MSNFSINVILSYDHSTKNLIVREGDKQIDSIPLLPNGISIEFSNNRLNINGFGITHPISSASFQIGDGVVPFIEWNKNELKIEVGNQATKVVGDTVVVGHKIGSSSFFIGVDKSKGNFGVKIRLENKTLVAEQGLVSALDVS